MKSNKFNALCLSLLIISSVTYGQQPLSLKACRKMAIESNQKVKIASENQITAENLKKAARTSYLPELGFTGSYLHMNKELGLLEKNQFLPVVPYSAITSEGNIDPSKLGPGDIVIDPSTLQPVLDQNGNPVFQKYTYLPQDAVKLDMRNSYLLNFGIVQPIYTGGKLISINKAADAMENMAKSGFTLENQQLIYDVDDTYWKMVSVKEKLKAAMVYQKMLDSLVYHLDNLVKEGVIINNDLMKAQVKKNEADLMVFKAENGLQLVRMSLCRLIGMPLESEIILSDSVFSESPAIDLTNNLNKALTQRPEISMLSYNINIAQSEVNIMKSRFLPDIGLTANYGWMNPSPFNGFAKEFEGDWNVGIVCKMPIFHWGERIHTLNAAKSQKKVNELKLEETRDLISLQTKQAEYNFSESLKKVEITKKSLAQAEMNLNVTNDKFHEGILKTTDVLEAQTLWQKAFSEYIDAKTEALVNESYLKKVVGDAVTDIQ